MTADAWYTTNDMKIPSGLTVNESELQFDFIRAAGPGGQNVNKVATAVQLRFDVRNSPTLPPDVKARLEKLAGSRMTLEGILVIEAKRRRTQEGNREDAIQRLAVLVQRAAQPPTQRRATRPTRASQTARLEAKKQRSEVKKARGKKLEWE